MAKGKARLAAAVLFYWALLFPRVQAQDYLNPLLPVQQRVDDLMSRMTQDEKIGQMMQADLSAVGRNPGDISTYRIGSILSGGGSDPAAGNGPLNWRDAYELVQSYALSTPLKIPIIYGIDAVHGHSNVVGATIFPHNIGLGCTRDSSLIREAARVTAVEMAATGIRWDFGPMIAVPRDIRWGRTYEAFGETPELAQLGAVQVPGLQGDSLNAPTSVLACTKHFLGDGGTAGGIDQGNTVGDEPTIRSIHLPGYQKAVEYGVGSIMASYSSINGEKMHANKHWLTDILKSELGFKGVVVSDWGGIDQLGNDYTQDVETSINAGVDMAMLPSRYDDFRTAMRSLLSTGKVTTSRLDDAVRRILTAKFEMGLFEHPYPDSTLLQSVGSADHRAIARRCVRESMVLLKRKDGVLPLPKANGRILVAGSHADNLGYQCGGWTISWQGSGGNTTVGTTILAGMKKIAPSAQIEYSLTGDFADTKADYSVVVIGETPYAEGYGDRADLHLPSSQVQLIRKMKSYGNPVVVILISGRPLIIENILHYSDAIVAAWLPGTEGDGIAEVLFGDNAPVGVLSHTWPKHMSQIPLNVGDINYAPLYPYGYGITSFIDSPSGSPPMLLSAIVNEDGSHIELTFNKAMKDPSGTQPVFVLTKTGSPSAANLSASLKPGDTTTIILKSAVVCKMGDTVKLGYTSGNVQSVDGGILAPFDDFEVYNWSSVETGVDGESANITAPLRFGLEQNYPNPFNPSTDILYSLKDPGLVVMKVFNDCGKEVKLLVHEYQTPGFYRARFDGSRFASGIYFCRLQQGNKSETRRLVLCK